MASEDLSSLADQIDRHIRQLSPHAREHDTGQLLVRAGAALRAYASRDESIEDYGLMAVHFTELEDRAERAEEALAVARDLEAKHEPRGRQTTDSASIGTRDKAGHSVSQSASPSGPSTGQILSGFGSTYDGRAKTAKPAGYNELLRQRNAAIDLAEQWKESYLKLFENSREEIAAARAQTWEKAAEICDRFGSSYFAVKIRAVAAKEQK